MAILAQPRRSRFELSGLLYLFALYALLHAPGDFVDMFKVWRPVSGMGQAVGHGLTFVSYGFLYEFGRRLWNTPGGRRLPAWTLLVLVAAVLVGTWLAPTPWPALHVFVGYFLRLPAGILAVVGLLRYHRARASDFPAGTKAHLGVAAIGLLVWTFFCGLVREPAGFFPADRLNVESIAAWTGQPVHVFRTLCALVVATAFVALLRLFHQEMVADLRRSLESQRQIDKLKDEFVAMASHELRAPLSAMRLALVVLDRAAGAGALPEWASKPSQVARASCERLSRLVDELLDWQTIRAGKLTLQPERLDPCAIVQAAVAELGPLAAQREVRLVPETVDLPPDCRLFGDRDRLIQSLLNLVANAIKYSPRGSEVRVLLEQPGGGMVRFSVIDRGPGVSQESAPLLFQPFSRGDRSRAGTGLGLAITRRIVELHGGSAGLESVPGQGARFYLLLPPAAAERGGRRAAPEPALPASASLVRQT